MIVTFNFHANNILAREFGIDQRSVTTKTKDISNWPEVHRVRDDNYGNISSYHALTIKGEMVLAVVNRDTKEIITFLRNNNGTIFTKAKSDLENQQVPEYYKQPVIEVKKKKVLKK